MQFIFQCLLVLEMTVMVTSWFLGKSKVDKHDLVAAKYDLEMPLRVRKILEKVGDEPILKIQLGRTPVQFVLLLVLDFLSKGEFVNKQLELGYDQIYHNYLLITIKSSKNPNVLQHLLGSTQNSVASRILKLEKAQRIGLMDPAVPAEFVDVFDIPLTPNKTLTLNRLISTASNVDKHFYSYDAANNNMCQTFVENIVDINGLTPNIIDNATLLALKPQDAKALIATLGSRSGIVKIVTDLGGTLDKLVFEGKIKWKKAPPKEFALLSKADVKSTHGTEEVYNAIVALEQDEKKGKQNRLIAIMVGCTVAAVLIVVAVAVFFILRKKNAESTGKAPNRNNLVEAKSDTSITVVSNAI